MGETKVAGSPHPDNQNLCHNEGNKGFPVDIGATNQPRPTKSTETNSRFCHAPGIIESSTVLRVRKQNIQCHTDVLIAVGGPESRRFGQSKRGKSDHEGSNTKFHPAIALFRRLRKVSFVEMCVCSVEVVFGADVEYLQAHI